MLILSPEQPLIRHDRPRLAILIVNFQSWPDVAALIETLARSPEVLSGLCELIVVDNDSQEPIPAVFRSPRVGVNLIVRSENGGFAAGVNEGRRASRAPWLLLLNPDVQAGPELVRQILNRLEFHTSHTEQAPAIVGFGLRNPDGSRQPSVGADPGLLQSLAAQFIPRSRRNYQADWRTKRGPVAWVTGACMLVESALLAEIGGMDEDFFLYYEEVALCRRARSLGRRVEYDDSVNVVHLHPLQNRPITPKMRVIVRHAKLLFFRKHQPAWQFWALSRIVGVESRLRGWFAEINADSAGRRAWDAIGSMARGMRNGEIPRGREVLLLAENAITEPKAIFKPNHTKLTGITTVAMPTGTVDPTGDQV